MEKGYIVIWSEISCIYDGVQDVKGAWLEFLKCINVRQMIELVRFIPLMANIKRNIFTQYVAYGCKSSAVSS